MKKKIRIVEGFYDVKRVGKVKRDQARTAKAGGMVGLVVKIEDAHSLYMKNAWVRKQVGKRRPVPGDMMVVILYDEIKEVVKKVKRVKKKVVDIVVRKEEVKAAVVNKVKEMLVNDLRSMFAPLMPVRTEKRKGNSVSPAVIFEMAGKADIRSAANMDIPLWDDRLSHALAA